MMPPAPTRMPFVPAATCAITTDVAALAIPGMLWCSASQNRLYPHRSACCARSSEYRSAVAASLPCVIGARSRTENTGIYSLLTPERRSSVLDAAAPTLQLSNPDKDAPAEQPQEHEPEHQHDS